MVDMQQYVPAEIEPRWQARWDSDGLYNSDINHRRPKYYALTMLPYPSGDMHIGHWYAMTPSDARARFKRMRGHNVLFPMGFDAFGLPAENAAIKNRIHPRQWTYANIDRMRRQLRTMGAMFDWRREVVTADPEYYRWTQWFFLQLIEHGLAYRKEAAVDWCPHCNTTLAREQVWGDDRHCERCGTPVIKKNLKQWFFRITNYAEELIDFSSLDWPERVRLLQTNWIGQSKGASVVFRLEEGDALEVFTTRPDTLWGATFMVLAPEHPLVEKITSPEQRHAVQEYIKTAERQSDIQREAADKEKTGVFTGGYAINPVNNQRIPVWIADYVLMTYGTGAIMAVPAHDERDFAFALKFGLPILPVIDRPDQLTKSIVPRGSFKPGWMEELQKGEIELKEEQDAFFLTIQPGEIQNFVELVHRFILPGKVIEIVGTQWLFLFSDGDLFWDSVESERVILAKYREIDKRTAGFRTLMEMLWSHEFYRDALYHAEYGTMINSGQFSGTPGESARSQVTEWLESIGAGKPAVNYRLRDWLISRQRYWGAPIPIIYCPDHGAVPVPESQLPVLLPDDVEWLPTGESPLKLHPTWKSTTCPLCSRPAERETDTMDTFMCSSWYHLRYLSPKYDQGPFDPREYDYWMPVDIYTGGIEHATMHLIYTRFFHKAGRDMGIMRGSEPMLQLRNQGIILGEDSEKMSKSRGNVVSPDDLVARYGADTVRAYLMFFARWEMGGPWNSNGIEGTARWMRRIWALFHEPHPSGQPNPETVRNLRRSLHQTLRQVTHDFETFEFNTIISALMELLNEMYRAREKGAGGTPAWEEALDIYLRMLAPVAPHIAEELWSAAGKPYSIHQQAWPEVDQEAAAEELVTLVIQVNGKLRDRIIVRVGIEQAKARELALASRAIQKILAGRTPQKVIVIQNKLVNIVI